MAGHWHGVGSGVPGRGGPGPPWELPEPTAPPPPVPSSLPTAVTLGVPADETSLSHQA